MDILSVSVCTETMIKNSRFIAELFPCLSQTEARELLKNQKNRYADATHVCHAFVIGCQGEILGMSDAGEPPGTAGRPMLDVLKGRKCTNTLLTVTRYFGGTLLGTGGLVKAYGGCAKAVLAQADVQNAFEPLIDKTSFSFTLSYPLYQSIRRYMAALHISDLKECYETDVTVSGSIRSDEADQLSAQVFNISSGKVTVKKSR